ncbi:SMC-Scp complex subunit ScpB [Candidatus Nomurabacteria bacterium]|nr:MAG: SMC-Scp complex subunit ScpB [Candidatus Nomurabacteria bacterium]
MNIELDAKIEALLFSKAEPVSIKELARTFNESEVSIGEALEKLKQKLSDRGVRLISHENLVTLSTAPECAVFLDEIRREELSRELSKASLETLSIILYTDKPTRGDIDYIRGVNSSFILRNLLVRGIIEKDIHPEDSRKFIYKPTLDLLRFLGITNVSDLENFSETKEKLNAFRSAKPEENTKE